MIVWRAQLTPQQLYDDRFMRRRLTFYYILVYLCCFVAVTNQRFFLENDYGLLIFNASVWIPQIAKTYKMRSRKGPSMSLVFSLSALQMFTPMYLKCTSDNFLDREPNRSGALLIILVLAFQQFVIRMQQIRGPRWFVPERYRIDPLAFNYYQTVPSAVLQRVKSRQ